MSERIYFRNRGRDSAVAFGSSPTAVSIVENRVYYVRGEETSGAPSSGYVACGAGTEFPLKVTRQELFEIYYRVKDAKFSGSLSAAYAFTTLELLFSTTPPPATYYSGTTSDVIVQRAYADQGTPPANLTNTKEMWSALHSTPSGILSHGIAIGLTHYAESFSVPLSDYYPYGLNVGGTTEWTARAEIAFGRRVAFVDNAANGNPFDPANDLWIEMSFAAYTEDSVAAKVDVYTLSTGGANEGPSGSLSIVLSNSTVTVPLIAEQFSFLVSASSSLSLVATEWWPYETTEGYPAWDANTGLDINGGFAA